MIRLRDELSRCSLEAKAPFGVDPQQIRRLVDNPPSVDLVQLGPYDAAVLQTLASVSLSQEGLV